MSMVHTNDWWRHAHTDFALRRSPKATCTPQHVQHLQNSAATAKSKKRPRFLVRSRQTSVPTHPQHRPTQRTRLEEMPMNHLITTTRIQYIIIEIRRCAQPSLIPDRSSPNRLQRFPGTGPSAAARTNTKHGDEDGEQRRRRSRISAPHKGSNKAHAPAHRHFHPEPPTQQERLVSRIRPVSLNSA